MSRMGKLIEDWMKSGKLLGTEGCMPTALGARVRIDDGKFTVSDGPFTEAKEVVGGFAILNAPSKEAAVEYVKEFLRVHGAGRVRSAPVVRHGLPAGIRRAADGSGGSLSRLTSPRT